MARHPHDIVPLDGTEELLLAIYDVLVEIRDALAPAHQEAPGPAPAEVSEAEASKAGATLAAHEHQPAKKTPARKPAAKKPTPKKKPA